MRARAARGGVDYRKECQGIPINLHMLNMLITLVALLGYSFLQITNLLRLLAFMNAGCRVHTAKH